VNKDNTSSDLNSGDDSTLIVTGVVYNKMLFIRLYAPV